MEQNSSGQGPAGGFDPARLKDVQTWRRSRSDRMVAGVCGGIGRALDIDPVLIRVVMAVLVLTGPGIFFYPAAWLLMPDEGSDRSAAQGLFGDRVDHPWLWPIVIGVCVFIAIATMSWFNVGRLVPGPLVVLGLIWLFVFRRKGHGLHGRGFHGRGFHGRGFDGRGFDGRGFDGRGFDGRGMAAPGMGSAQGADGNHWAQRGAQWIGRPPDAPADSPAAAPGSAPYLGPPAAPTGPSEQAGPASSATQRPQDRTVEPVQPVWTEDDPLGLYVDDSPPAPHQRPTAEPPAKGYRGVKPLVVLLSGIAIAVAWSAGSSTPTMLAIGLATLGIGMLVGGFVGRTLGLVPLGVLLAAGVLASSVFHSVPRDFADIQFAAAPTVPITATSTTYRFDAGSVRLDLSKATFAPGAKVVVHGGLGEIVVTLPPTVDVTGTLSAEAGDVRALGQDNGGHHPSLTVSDLGADNKAGPQSVELQLDLKLGSIKVERG